MEKTLIVNDCNYVCFQHDSALPHNTQLESNVINIEFEQSKGVLLVFSRSTRTQKWPSRSQDIKIVDFYFGGWEAINAFVYVRLPRNTQELCTLLTNVSHSITRYELYTLIIEHCTQIEHSPKGTSPSYCNNINCGNQSLQLFVNITS